MWGEIDWEDPDISLKLAAVFLPPGQVYPDIRPLRTEEAEPDWAN